MCIKAIKYLIDLYRAPIKILLINLIKQSHILLHHLSIISKLSVQDHNPNFSII